MINAHEVLMAKLNAASLRPEAAKASGENVPPLPSVEEAQRRLHEIVLSDSYR